MLFIPIFLLSNENRIDGLHQAYATPHPEEEFADYENLDYNRLQLQINVLDQKVNELTTTLRNLFKVVSQPNDHHRDQVIT